MKEEIGQLKYHYYNLQFEAHSSHLHFEDMDYKSYLLGADEARDFDAWQQYVLVFHVTCPEDSHYTALN